MASDESSPGGVPGELYAGQIWRIPDHLLTFADADPARRTLHRERPVLIVQGDDIGANADCSTVLVMPLSGGTANRRLWEDELAIGESPLDRASVVKVHLLLPIPRTVVIEEATWVGDIDETALLRILARLVANLGLT